MMIAQHATQIRVRYDEADPMGLLHHANYFTCFEIGRTELLRANGGSYRKMEEEGDPCVAFSAALGSAS